MSLALVVVLCIFLAGCSSVSGLSSPGSPFGDVLALTVADLEAALADATAHQDLPAMQCYPVLLGIVKNLPSQLPTAGAPKGVVSTFQAARDLSKKAQTFSGANDPLIQAVNLGCAALYNDAKGDALRLGIKVRP
jgi:uncharacterized protein YceK